MTPALLAELTPEERLVWSWCSNTQPLGYTLNAVVGDMKTALLALAQARRALREIAETNGIERHEHETNEEAAVRWGITLRGIARAALNAACEEGRGRDDGDDE